MSQYIKIDKIKLNPANPRTITGERFEKLVHSVANFPSMLSIRGVVVDSEMMSVGGNQRWTAICSILTMPKEDLHRLIESSENLKMWEGLRKKQAVPSDWIVSGAHMTPEEIRQFVIVDNVPFGQDDIQQLMSSFSQEDLEMWGSETVLPKMPEFTPNLMPTTSYKNVKEGDIETAGQRMQDNLDARPELISLRCPHCFEEFQIQKPS